MVLINLQLGVAFVLSLAFYSSVALAEAAALGAPLFCPEGIGIFVSCRLYPKYLISLMSLESRERILTL
jgi:hypothetical protein